MTFYEFDIIKKKKQLLGLCNFYLIKRFNKCIHLLIFFMFQNTEDINLKLWENSHYLTLFLPTVYLLH